MRPARRLLPPPSAPASIISQPTSGGALPWRSYGGAETGPFHIWTSLDPLFSTGDEAVDIRAMIDANYDPLQNGVTRRHDYLSHESIHPRRCIPLGPLPDFTTPHGR